VNMNLLAASLLSPLALAYGAASRLRNLLYDRGLLKAHRCTLPVISIGNITAGGNSKTPLAIYLARALEARGHRPVILSRGYRGQIRGPYQVRRDDPASLVGDEPAMMASQYGLNVVVAADRVRGADYIVRGRLGTVIILDDGFQHRRLGRNLDIVCINAGNREAADEFRRGWLLPAGRFRENRDRALRRAAVVVLAERQPPRAAGESVAGLFEDLIPPRCRVFRSFIVPQTIVSLRDGTALRGSAAFAFCSIANPQAFLDTLEALGIRLQGRRIFPDHHFCGPQELLALRKEAGAVPLICTEKDAVRLKLPEGMDVHVLRISCRLEKEEEFLAHVSAVLQG